MMNKKVIYAICILFIVVVTGGLLIFVFSGDKDSEEVKKYDIKGTWEVIAQVEKDVPTYVDNQFMIFDSEKAYSYKDDTSKPYATSIYEVTEDNKVVLSEISREYVLDGKTENYMRLYENKDKYLLLIKYPNSDMKAVEVNADDIIGKWNVINRTDESGNKIDEVLEFNMDTMNDYRNGAKEPSASSSYSWKEEGVLFADAWNKSYECHVISEKVIVFIEIDTGIVMELHKVD